MKKKLIMLNKNHNNKNKILSKIITKINYKKINEIHALLAPPSANTTPTKSNTLLFSNTHLDHIAYIKKLHIRFCSNHNYSICKQCIPKRNIYILNVIRDIFNIDTLSEQDIQKITYKIYINKFTINKESHDKDKKTNYEQKFFNTLIPILISNKSSLIQDIKIKKIIKYSFISIKLMPNDNPFQDYIRAFYNHLIENKKHIQYNHHFISSIQSIIKNISSNSIFTLKTISNPKHYLEILFNKILLNIHNIQSNLYKKVDISKWIPRFEKNKILNIKENVNSFYKHIFHLYNMQKVNIEEQQIIFLIYLYLGVQFKIPVYLKTFNNPILNEFKQIIKIKINQPSGSKTNQIHDQKPILFKNILTEIYQHEHQIYFNNNDLFIPPIIANKLCQITKKLNQFLTKQKTYNASLENEQIFVKFTHEYFNIYNFLLLSQTFNLFHELVKSITTLFNIDNNYINTLFKYAYQYYMLQNNNNDSCNDDNLTLSHSVVDAKYIKKNILIINVLSKATDNTLYDLDQINILDTEIIPTDIPVNINLIWENYALRLNQYDDSNQYDY